MAIAGIVAFIAYAVAGELLIPEFEITLFLIFFQGMGYLFMMAVANVFYFLGPILDKTINRSNSENFRRQCFSLGCLFSYVLPFTIPGLIIFLYGYNSTVENKRQKGEKVEVMRLGP